MEDTAFDHELVAAAFEQAALTGWRGLSIVDAARAAGLPLDRARARCPGPAAVLMRFGLMADQAALAQPSGELLARDRLFDLLMQRFDVLQQHRAGMLALLRYLPTDPILSFGLSAATGRSMAWMLEAAGVSAAGLIGQARVAGLVGVWLYALRAWKDDESADLAGTMSALDKGLDQAEKFARSLPGAIVPPVAEPELEPGPVDMPTTDMPTPGVPTTNVPKTEMPKTEMPGADEIVATMAKNPPAPPPPTPPPSPEPASF